MQQTIFLDIDGCIFKHHGGPCSDALDKPTEVLPGVKEKICQWFTDGIYICLTTARPECWRERTVLDLNNFAIPYHQLIMGIGHGIRTVINDEKETVKQTAYAITVERNKGFENLKLPIIKYDKIKPSQGFTFNIAQTNSDLKASNLLFWPSSIGINYEYYVGLYPEGCACEACCSLVDINAPVVTHTIYKITNENNKERIFYAREDMVNKDIIEQVRKKYGV